jgi:hypothetical protein
MECLAFERSIFISELMIIPGEWISYHGRSFVITVTFLTCMIFYSETIVSQTHPFLGYGALHHAMKLQKALTRCPHIDTGFPSLQI